MRSDPSTRNVGPDGHKPIGAPEIGLAMVLVCSGWRVKLSRPNIDLTVAVADPVRMPLAEAARTLGTTPDALRQKIKRGKLQAVRDNTGRLLVWVDPDALPAVEASRRSVAVQSEQPSDLSSHVKSLADQLERLELTNRLVDQLRADHLAELERLHAAHAAELDRARQETDRWRDHAERERQHSRDLADRLDQLHRDHAADQARPWWRRLLGQ